MQVELLPQQYDFVFDDESQRLLIHGGRGSAKSTGLDWKIYRRAMHPGACEFLGRQRLIDLRTTTLRLLLEGAGSMPPVIPPGTYHHDKTEKIIRLHGGGQIVYNGMDQGDVGRQIGSTGRGSSMNLSGAAIDEAVEVSEANLIQIAGAVRVPVEGIPLQIYMACNPSVPSHHLARDFGLAQGHVAKPGFRAIHCNPVDNYFLPPEFIASLEALEGVARERYLLGRWVGSDGLVYDRWDRNTHVRESTAPAKRVVLGVDEGYTDPFVALLIHIDPDGRVHVAREVFEARLTQAEKIERVRSLADGSPEVFVDAAAPDLIESMRRANINARPAEKGQGSVNHGIGLIQQRLVVQGDGRPRLTVDPSCTNTIREFESYEWKPGTDRLKDEPRDANNHAMDALRYAVRSIDEGERFLAYFPSARTKSRDPWAAGGWR